MIQIEVNGIKVSVKSDSRLIDVIENLKINIPSFCYHKKLSIVSSCRMCLVQIDNIPKPIPACSTFVRSGMKVFTNSEMVISAQKDVMEFLLINHPLDCPICDQGGECDLQDLSLEYGNDKSRFMEIKRIIEDDDWGYLIKTNLTRCILCTRCVRLSREILGINNIGVINRGLKSKIKLYDNYTDSNLFGNVIDVCPVGALTSKVSEYKARPWEMYQFPFFSPHDCIGSNLNGHAKDGKLIRVVPCKNEDINDIWISDRDRFSYEGIYNSDRLQEPMIKYDNSWNVVSWDKAISYLCDKISYIKDIDNISNFGALSSYNSTLEELYLFQKLFRSLGVNNIDHRLKQIDFNYQDKFPLYQDLGINISNISKQDVIFLIGANISNEQPILSIELRKMSHERDGQIFSLNDKSEKKTIYKIANQYNINNEKYIEELLIIIKTISHIKKIDINLHNFNDEYAKVKYNSKYDDLVKALLLNSDNKSIIIGSSLILNNNYSKIIFLSNFISKIIKSKMGFLTHGSNSAGAWIAGCIPHRSFLGDSVLNVGENALNIIKCENINNYCLFGINDEKDFNINKDVLKNKLAKSNLIISMSSYFTNFLKENAHIILPMNTLYETSGTLINVNGIWQTYKSILKPIGNSKCGWSILNMINNKLCLFSDKYLESNDILEEIKYKFNNKNINNLYDFNIEKYINEKNIEKNINILSNADLHYDVDYIVRKAVSLQKNNKKLG